MGQKYLVKHVEEVKDWDKDQYGNTWYTMKLAEHADNVLILAQNPPEVDKTIYGRLEPTKSGKAYRFRKEQLPEDGVVHSAQPQMITPTSEQQVVSFTQQDRDMLVEIQDGMRKLLGEMEDEVIDYDG